MFWVGCLVGYFVGTLVTFLLIYFVYRIGELNKAGRNWNEITSIDESVMKEMEQLKSIRSEGK